MQELMSFLKNLIPRGMEFVLSVVTAVLVLVIGMKIVKKFLAGLKKSMLKNIFQNKK